MRLLSALAAVGVVAALAAGGASSSSSFDRSPVRVAGLKADSWGQSTTQAESQLRKRYAGITRDYCVGAIMIGDAADSYFVQGMTRYWDKLVCAGTTASTGNAVFALIFDAKGRNSWVIYRLKGATIHALRGG
jgi:hypothetical protein